MAARGKSGSVIGYVVSIGIMALLLVVSVVVIVFLFAQLNKKDITEQEAKKELLKFYDANSDTGEAKTLADMWRGANPEYKQSMVRAVLQENEALKKMLSGQLKSKYLFDSFNTPNNKLYISEADVRDKVLKIGAAQTAEEKLQTLSSELQTAKTERDATKTALDNALKAVKAALADKDKQAVDFRASDTKMNAQIASLQDSQKNYENVARSEQAKLKDQFDATQANHTKQIREYQDKVTSLENELKDLNQRLYEISRKTRLINVGTAQEQPDGTILSVLPEDRRVYISLGRSKHLPLGITFEVFDRNTLIKKDNYGDVRGKATIEVVRIDENSAIAQVVRIAPGRTLAEGDAIVNLVYDPNMKLNFLLFGDFDIDKTGTPSTTDKRRLETWITTWGGAVLDKYDPQVDIVVLGAEPPDPGPRPTTTDSDIMKAYDKRVANRQAYQDLINQARADSVPFVNLNRFLILTGYYQRVPTGAQAR